ncbi:hypothetical protein HPB49_025051 [Dermacentor silvarum]|uniref:Uncharacterized protein n=1 Tax=Dermacentor silvarum TaxID=543639 RepID=A0ACB8CUC0_DERSI|nr:chaoptin [Dermacentor silvarum]KAH7950513.1 hypothetical protein HPB49_025051 [Dermacentor silvarum]
MYIPTLSWRGRLLLGTFPLLVYLCTANALTWQQRDTSQDSESSAQPCDFNALCTCDDDRMKAYCHAVPLTTLPETSGYADVTIEGCTLLRILRNSSSLRPSNVVSLHVNDNQLSQIEDGAFGSVPNLANLDLSRNRLTNFPSGAVLSLTRLQRLDLRFNSIGELDAKELATVARRLVSLRSLHLSSNVITSVHDAMFHYFGNLTILDLDNNNILRIEGRPFPPSLVRLNLTGNLLEQVPGTALAQLRNLSYLLLGDNAIQRLDPNWTLPTEHLDTLNLGRNVISQLPPRMFQNQKKVTVRHFVLADNYHRYVPPNLFRTLAPRHVSFSVNHIESLPEGLFQGLDDVVIHLDLAHNKLHEFPGTIAKLRRLHTLNMRDNQLSEFGEYDLFSCRVSLRVLDISNNNFDAVPKIALKFLSRLKSLNMADNALTSIERQDFKHGLDGLLSLDLSGNNIVYIEDHAFETLSKLADLRLAYNPITTLNFNWFPKGCSNLKAIDISGTRLVPDTVNRFLQSCQRINSLDATYARLPNLETTILNQMSELIALNVMQNDWRYVPKDFLNGMVQTKLTTIKINQNYISEIQPRTFSDLARLQVIDLSANEVTHLKTKTFINLHNLTKLNLSHNKVSVIDAGALTELPRLRDIDLSFNKLSDFNVQFIVNRNTHHLLQLNLSHNKISHLRLSNGAEHVILNVTSLDLSHNLIESVARHFFWTTRHSLTFLNLSHNFLSTMSVEVASELPRVKVLDLSHNRIAQLSPRSFQASSEIHVLLLSHNQLCALPEEAFTRMAHLQILALDNNCIASLPEDAFEETPLVHLSLSHNWLPRPFTKAFAPARTTLTHLDLSHNRIKLIAGTEFDHLFNLESLNLSSNEIIILPGQVFANLSRMVVLDVSRNPLLRVEPGSLNLPVTSLSLDNCNLTTVPYVNAPKLVELSLSLNSIANFSATSFANLRMLRKLDLSSNHIREIDPGWWAHVTDLRSLDVSRNPIRSLGSGSFRPLSTLHHLDITGLQLDFLDARTLDSLKSLRSVKTNTYSSARAFRLQEILLQAKALQTLVVHVDEATLSYQIQWAFSKKIRELSVSGSELRSVAADAFEGLHPHGPFTFRVRECPLLESLPAGLLRRWAQMPRLSVDLSDNTALTSFVAGDEEEALQELADGSAQERRPSHYVSSSFSLRGTPWTCDCRLLWFRHRLLRQRRHLSKSPEATRIHSAEPRCAVPGTSVKTVAISELRPNTPHCAGDASSSGSVGADFLVVLYIVMVVAVLRFG